MTTFSGVKPQQKYFDSYIQWFEFMNTRPWLNQKTKVNVHNHTVLPVSDR